MKNTRENDGTNFTELYKALALGDRNKSQSLLQTLPKTLNPDGLLLYAAYGGDQQLVAEILDRGVDINTLGNVDHSAEILANAQGLFNAAIETMERAVSASALGKIGFVLPHIPTPTKLTSYFSASALMVAAGQGHSELVSFLLERCASLQHTDALGRSAFDIAEKAGYSDITASLSQALAKQVQKESTLSPTSFAKAQQILQELLTFRYGMSSPKWDIESEVKLALFLLVSKKTGEDSKCFGEFELAKILKEPFEPSVAYLHQLLSNLARSTGTYSPLPSELQIPLFVWALEKLEPARAQISKELKEQLKLYREQYITYLNRAYIGNDYFDPIYSSLTRLVDNQGLISSRDQLGATILESKVTDNEAWLVFLGFCATASGSTPGKNWIKLAQKFLSLLQPNGVLQHLTAWFVCASNITSPLYGTDTSTRFLDPRHESILKGLIWCAPLLGRLDLVEPIGNLVERSYRKIPKIGPFSVALGGAGIFALSQWEGMEGIAELCRLKVRIKYKQGLSRIEKVLKEVAKSRDLSSQDLEEISVPNFGMQESGVFAVCSKHLKVRTSVQPDGSLFSEWHLAENEAHILPEKTAKKDFPPEFKTLVQQVNRFEEIYIAQRLLLERWLASTRNLDIQDWRVRYLEHPLLKPLVSRLIWSLSTEISSERVFIDNGVLIDVVGNPSILSNTACRVALWHPVESPDLEVLKWCEFLEQRQIVQPFKQAHREIYFVAPDERTLNKTQRFSGYLLRQHQLAALCRERGWSIGLQGTFDSYTPPSRTFLEGNAKLTFHVQPSKIQDESDSGVYLAVASDVAEFHLEDTPLAQGEIPARIYSELLRDVDLFVSAAAIGLDQGKTQLSYTQASELSRKRSENLQHFLRASPHIDRVKLTSTSSIDIRGLDADYTLSLSRAVLRDAQTGLELEVSPTLLAKAPLYLPYRGDDILASLLKIIALVVETKRIKFKTKIRGEEDK